MLDRDAKPAVTSSSGLPMTCEPASQSPLRIALIGTDGLPARYGGFETCVAELAPRLVALGHQVEVFGSSIGRGSRAADRSGLRHRYLPLRANGPASVPYDLLSEARRENLARWRAINPIAPHYAG